jgi:hypothetical protein
MKIIKHDLQIINIFHEKFNGVPYSLDTTEPLYQFFLSIIITFFVTNNDQYNFWIESIQTVFKMFKFYILLICIVYFGVIAAICPTNEVWSTSSAGCQKSCTYMVQRNDCKKKAGCICKSGYVRTSLANRTCIPTSSCKK